MIRRLEERDFDAVTHIVNTNWKSVYTGYVAPDLLSEAGCARRRARLRSDFMERRLDEYVWEENGQVLALLSAGDTADTDRPSAFEVWRLYIAPAVQGRGIGRRLLTFAENLAVQRGYRETLIWAFSGNRGAIAFYQKCGYRIEKEEYLGEPYFAYGTRLLKAISADWKTSCRT